MTGLLIVAVIACLWWLFLLDRAHHRALDLIEQQAETIATHNRILDRLVKDRWS